jgi:protease-4
LTIALACFCACEGRPRQADGKHDEAPGQPTEPHLAEIDLRNGVSEEAEAPLFGPGGRSHSHLVLRLRELERAEHSKGVFVRLGTATMGLARAEELGRLLGALREEKKLPVVCHADAYDNATMLLAARGCDEIWLSPAGEVDTIGIAAQLVFARAMLEQLHVKVDFLQVGKYKGASEPFTRDEASPEARESLRKALKGLRGAWLEGIEKGRGKSASKLEIEDGPHTAEHAKKLGLIDAIGFERQARDRAAERAGVTARVSYFGGRDKEDQGVASFVRLLSGTGSADVPHIAVLPTVGSITVSDGSIFSQGGIVERDLVKTIERLKNNDNTRAVVMRIDSPGGSALASDLLWRALMDLREKKPLVVSVGGMAASGGYYLASAATKVVAERSSIVGSIGVVAGKLSFADSLAELGIHVEAVAAKEGAEARALYGSPLQGWDDATRSKILDGMESTYRLFVSRIAEGRGLTTAKITPYAEGRIMGGSDAQKAQLVDQLGGLDDAIELAIELTSSDRAIAVQIVQEPSGLMSLLGADTPEARASFAIEQQAARRTARSFTALLPYRRELEILTANVAPLAEGEHILATLPFALTIR